MTVRITVTNMSGQTVSSPFEGRVEAGEHYSIFRISSMFVTTDLSGGVPGWFDTIDDNNEYVTDSDPLNDGRSM